MARQHPQDGVDSAQVSREAASLGMEVVPARSANLGWMGKSEQPEAFGVVTAFLPSNSCSRLHLISTPRSHQHPVTIADMARTKKSKPGKGKQTKASASEPKKQPAAKAKATTKATAKQIKSQPKSLLLDKIPAEVRNQIWRDVLVTVKLVDVSKDKPHQPALLRTCRQIREEATPIYFNENGFNLPMDGYDSTLGLKWCKFAMPHFKNGMACLDWEREPGTETWEDLKIWLQRTHAGLVPRYSPTYYPIGCDEQAEEMFDFLEEHVRLSWKKILPKLEKHKNFMEDREECYEFGLFDNPGSDC